MWDDMHDVFDDEPEHWAGDAGAVAEATFYDRAATYVNVTLAAFLDCMTLGKFVDLPTFTAEDMRAWLEQPEPLP